MTDFAPGDVVVCVDNAPDPSDPLAQKLQQGRYYRVAVVGLRSSDQAYSIGFRDLISRPGKAFGWSAWRFRKLKAADEQFTEQMRALRPAKVRATLSRSSENRNG